MAPKPSEPSSTSQPPTPPQLPRCLPTFQGIPHELRLMIFDHVLADSDHIIYLRNNSDLTPKRLQPPLFSISRQFYTESLRARNRYWSSRTFRYDATGEHTFGFDALTKWLCGLSSTTRLQIRHLVVDIDEWAVHNSPTMMFPFRIWSDSIEAFVRLFLREPGLLIESALGFRAKHRMGYNTRQPWFGQIVADIRARVKKAREEGRSFRVSER